MTDGMFKVVLERAGGKSKKDGTTELPDGRTLTLHAAHGGAALSVGKVTTVREKSGIIEASNVAGELFVLALEDVFAATVSGGDAGKPGRKAGFLG